MLGTEITTDNLTNRYQNLKVGVLICK
uniref:Uncharacterized protein n=1 Tax=Arundo donax TaxID=35708 RepID=A0A0A9DVS9_ARUDO